MLNEKEKENSQRWQSYHFAKVVNGNLRLIITPCDVTKSHFSMYLVLMTHKM